MIGCTTVPKQNLPLDHFSKQHGYRFSNLAPGDNNSDSLFVVLTFSGGGPRAASLALGVLQKLRDTRIVWEGENRRLLDEVDVISSVSGGSLTAAYYGLFQDRLFEDFADKVLSIDYTKTLVTHMLFPSSWTKLASPYYDRTDLMADKLMDGEIFENNTFADLRARGRRPFFIINATDMSLGRTFSFTQNYFDMLYSDLDPYPVGYAVAASGAFPGVLPPVTLCNHENQKDYERPAWALSTENKPGGSTIRQRQTKALESYVRPGRPYLHLVDGGVSDNLGLIPVILALDGAARVEGLFLRETGEKIQKMVIITVNARINVYRDWDTKPKVPNMFKVLKKSGMTPKDNYSQGQIEYLKMLIRNKTECSGPGELKAAGADGVKKPLIDSPRTTYYFIEVSFEALTEKPDIDFINQVRIYNKLEKEEIDRIGDAAGKILDGDPKFRALIEELQ